MLDYTAEDLNGKSLYGLCHAADMDKIKQTHTDCKFTMHLTAVKSIEYLNLHKNCSKRAE